MISGNGGHGVRIAGPNTTNTSVYQNIIGADVTETLPRGNAGNGVSIEMGAQGTSLQFNTIGANQTGVSITGAATGPTDLRVNYIGVNRTLTDALPNISHGVSVDGLTGNNFIGSAIEPSSGSGDGGNTIRNNGSDGISVTGSLSTIISANSIDENDGLGINNDSAFPLAPPVLASADNNGGTHVMGTATAFPNSSLTVEFFASPACDPSGSGEGLDYLGAVVIMANGAGTAEIDTVLSPGASAGQVITATVSEEATTEFSNCVTVSGSTPTPSPTPSPTSSTTPTPTPSPTPTATAVDTPTATPDGSPTPTPTPGELIWGDLNCSGDVDAVDALLTLRHDAGLPANTGDCPDFGEAVPAGGPSLTWGDIDCNGAINAVDALKLLRFDAGLSVEQEDGCPTIGEPVTS